MESDQSDRVQVSLPVKWLGPILQTLTLGSVVTFGGIWQASASQASDQIARVEKKLEAVEAQLEAEARARNVAELASVAARSKTAAELAALAMRVARLENADR